MQVAVHALHELEVAAPEPGEPQAQVGVPRDKMNCAYSEVWKLSSQSSTGVPALLRCAMLQSKLGLSQVGNR